LNNLTAAEATAAHPWNQNGAVDAAGLENWVQGRLARQSQLIDALLAVQGERSLENTLRPYDDAVAT